MGASVTHGTAPPLLILHYYNYLMRSTSPSGKRRFFHFRLPVLPLLGISKQSLPQEAPDNVMVESPCHSDDSLTMCNEQVANIRESWRHPKPNDTNTLIVPSFCSTPVSGPLDHSSPKSPWDKLYPDEASVQIHDKRQGATIIAATSIPGLTPTASRESVCSIRRASSLYDIEGFRPNSRMAFRDRHASEGRTRHVRLYQCNKCMENI